MAVLGTHWFARERGRVLLGPFLVGGPCVQTSFDFALKNFLTRFDSLASVLVPALRASLEVRQHRS